jgi:hypothetical protein
MYIQFCNTCSFSLLALYQSINPSLRPCEVFCNIISFYGEELLASCQTPKLEDRPCRMSVTAYSIYLQLPSISGGWSSNCNLRTCGAMVTGTHLFYNHSVFKTHIYMNKSTHSRNRITIFVIPKLQYSKTLLIQNWLILNTIQFEAHDVPWF